MFNYDFFQELATNNGFEANKGLFNKNNESLEGITLKSENSNISPIMYMRDIEDKDTEEVFNFMMSKMSAGFSINPEKMVDLDKLFIKLINYKANKDHLQEIPYRMFGDLAVTYRVEVETAEEGTASYEVNNKMLNGITEQELFDHAVRNMEEKNPSKFRTMAEVLEELMGFESPIDDDGGIYVLTNQTGLNGASAMLENGILDRILDRMETDVLTILPSSIHEVIILDGNMDGEKSGMADMVVEVNRSCLRPEERLSNNVYEYTREHGFRVKVATTEKLA